MLAIFMAIGSEWISDHLFGVSVCKGSRNIRLRSPEASKSGIEDQ